MRNEILRGAIGRTANCRNYSSYGITFFRFVTFYDSTITRWYRIGKIKLERSSSVRLLLFAKSCKVFLDFTYKCRCWASVRYYRFSDLFFYFSYGVFVVKNYKTGQFFAFFTNDYEFVLYLLLFRVGWINSTYWEMRYWEVP